MHEHQTKPYTTFIVCQQGYFRKYNNSNLVSVEFSSYAVMQINGCVNQELLARKTDIKKKRKDSGK